MKPLHALIALWSLWLPGVATAQWGATPEENALAFPAGTTSYAAETAVADNGYVWSMIYHPNATQAAGEEDVYNVVYEYRLQCFDPEGRRMLPEEGIVVSDYKNKSYVVVNNYLLTDHDGNAIVMVSDLRNSNDRGMSFTAYRVSPTGEQLWGREGVAVSNPKRPCSLFSCMQGVEMDDGSFMFAWVEYPGAPQVHVQRLSPEGKRLWGDEGRVLDTEACYPFLVKSVHNTAILVYAGGPSKVLYAKKIDFDGKDCWAKDAMVYRGGWGSTPLQTMVKVTPSGDGGVLVAWHDDRRFSGTESAYLSYVTYEGKVAFTGASDDGDVKLDYEGYRCFIPQACPASDGSGFYVAFRTTTHGQNYQGVKVQKVSRSGELLFGENAVEVMPIVIEGDPAVMHTGSGYVSVQPDREGGACVFWGKYFSWGNEASYARRVNADGSFAWSDEVRLSPEGVAASGLKSHSMPGGNAWLYNYGYSLNVISADGVIGAAQTGIPSVSTPAAASESYSLFTLDGRKVATIQQGNALGGSLPAGVYIKKGADSMRAEKVFLK